MASSDIFVGLLYCVLQENEEDVLRRIHMSSGSRLLNPGAAPVSRPATGMGPVTQMSTQPISMLGNAATMSNDFSMQLLHDLGIDVANITNQVFIANVSRHFCSCFVALLAKHLSLLYG